MYWKRIDRESGEITLSGEGWVRRMAEEYCEDAEETMSDVVGFETPYTIFRKVEGEPPVRRCGPHQHSLCSSMEILPGNMVEYSCWCFAVAHKWVALYPSALPLPMMKTQETIWTPPPRCICAALPQK